MEIKVLGSGCANCVRLAEMARSVAEELGVPANVEKVTDMQQIMAYGILATPGLVIDGRLTCSGRVPSRAEITTWVADAASGPATS